MTVTVIVFGPTLSGIGGLGMPEVTGFPFTVTVAFGSCTVGVTVMLEPHGVLKVGSEARAEDGKIAAILVRARRPGVARVIVKRAKGQRTIVTIRVHAEPSPCAAEDVALRPTGPESETREYDGAIVSGIGRYAKACGDMQDRVDPVHSGVCVPEWLEWSGVHGQA